MLEAHFILLYKEICKESWIEENLLDIKIVLFSAITI